MTVVKQHQTVVTPAMTTTNPSLVNLSKVIVESNALYQSHIVNGTTSYIPYLTSTVLFKRTTSTAMNHYNQGGKFVLHNQIGKGTYGVCFSADYHPPGDPSRRPMVAKIMVAKYNKDLGGFNLNRNGIPQAIWDEVFIQRRFMKVPGVVHAFHAAELRCVNHTPETKQVIDTQLFNSDTTAFQPQAGDRLFLLCLEKYDYNLRACLEYERYFFLHKKMPDNAQIHVREPPLGENYLKLAIYRFYRLRNAVGDMHLAGHGHFDALPKNILLRHSRDPSEVDLCDFGWSAKFKSMKTMDFDDNWSCYPPESTVTSGIGDHGIPFRAQTQHSEYWKYEYMSYDFYCLGYTLFDMLQNYFHPSDFWECVKWSEQGIKELEYCLERVEGFKTTRVIRDLALAFLSKDERYEKVYNMTIKFPTAEALWAEHEKEVVAMSHPDNFRHYHDLEHSSGTESAASSAINSPLHNQFAGMHLTPPQTPSPKGNAKNFGLSANMKHIPTALGSHAPTPLRNAV